MMPIVEEPYRIVRCWRRDERRRHREEEHGDGGGADERTHLWASE